MKKTVAYCSKNKLCCSCGFCFDVCPKKAIKVLNKGGIFVPSINKDLCNKCGLCFDLCAGKGNDWYNQSIELNNDIKDSYVQNVGLYRESYISNAVDYETRFHGASGGTVSSLLIFMLENKIIDGAIVTQFKKTNPLEVETIIATSKEEILNAKSSKYCPVHMDSILTQLKEFKGKVAIVGLPCHLQTIRRIERKLSWVKDKIVFHIGLFCSGSKDSNALNYLLKSNNFDINGITKFSYRDDGCLGYVKAEYTNKSISVPYEQAYSKLHSYFKPERCLSCIDHFAYLSDVSIGDIDCEPYSNDKIGSNSVIIRSVIAKDIFEEAIKNNVIQAKIIPITEIVRSQRVLNYRNQTYKANRLLSKLLFKKNVEYDKKLDTKLSFKGIKCFFSYKLQRMLRKFGLIK